MSFACLTACLHLDGPNDTILGVARDVAVRFGARVTGLAVKQASMHVAGRGVGPSEPHEYELNKFKECARTTEQQFRKRLEGVNGLAWRAQLTFGPATEFIAAEARGADLVLVLVPTGRPESYLFPSGHAEPGDLLMRLGRPLLAAPEGVTGLFFGRALVCWKDSREARRAVADSLPFLKAMQRVEVVELAGPRDVEGSQARLGDVKEWLARHGVEANCRAELTQGAEATQLAELARDMDADLIVAGGFGHSRLREWAFGGVTRDLVLNSDRCVLTSH